MRPSHFCFTDPSVPQRQSSRRPSLSLLICTSSTSIISSLLLITSLFCLHPEGGEVGEVCHRSPLRLALKRHTASDFFKLLRGALPGPPSRGFLKVWVALNKKCHLLSAFFLQEQQRQDQNRSQFLDH